MNWRFSTGIALLLLAMGLAYANSFHNGFHFDDFHTVVDNPAIRSTQNIPRFFTDATTFSVLPANRSYRPMVSTTLALDYSIAHAYLPLWFHVDTFALFLAQVLLVLVLSELIFNKAQPDPANKWLALVVAAWYGLHPAMAETINYVIQRGDLYCTLGSVAALYLYARWPRLRIAGLYLIPLVFALLSKPPAAVFPLLLGMYVLLFEACLPGKSKAPTRSVRLLSSVVAVLPSITVTALLLWLQSAMTPKSFLPSIISPSDYRLTQPFVWLRYFGALLLPLHLNVDTDLAPFHELNPQAIAGLVFLAALLAAIGYSLKRRERFPIAFGLLWFVFTQLPTSLYPLSEVENDHRMFFSFVGLMIAVVWAVRLTLEHFFTRSRLTFLKPAFAASVFVALCGYGYGVHVRNQVWRSEETLWLDDVTKSPHNGRGLMIYGLTQMAQGMYQAALGSFEQALVFAPDYATLEINLGIVNGAMADRGDVARASEARRHFLRAIALQPGDDTTHAYYARWLVEHNQLDAAQSEIAQAIALNPSRLFQREMLVQAYDRAGDAKRTRQAALELAARAPNDTVAQQVLDRPPSQNLNQAGYQPATQNATQNATQSAAFWVNLSLAQNRQGQYAASIESARHALALDTRSAEAWNNIAANNEAMHRWDEAINAAQVAVALKPDFQLARNNLNWSLSQKKLAAR